jgi:hypothetical protein
MSSLTVQATAKFNPYFNAHEPVVTYIDVAEHVSNAMAHEAAALAVKNVRGAAKRVAMLKTITVAIKNALAMGPAGLDSSRLMFEIELAPNAEVAHITFRERTTLDAMKEAVCGK